MNRKFSSFSVSTLFYKEVHMNRKLMSAMWVVFVMLLCSIPSVWGNTLSLESAAIPNPFGTTTPYNISAAGSIDWVLPGIDRKSGGTALQTETGDGPYTMPYAPSLYPDSTQPRFSYTDGTNVGSATVTAYYDYPVPHNNISLAAGSGNITVWWGSGGGTGTPNSMFYAWFDDAHDSSVISQSATTGDMAEVTVHYELDAPRTIDVCSVVGTGGYNAGWFGIAVGVSPVPEPGTLTLLTCGSDRPALLRLAQTEVGNKLPSPASGRGAGG